MKLLMSADLHLGRWSSRVSDGARHSAIACWNRMVELAISEGVHAVLLAGDVIDQSNRIFESQGPLKRGVEQLAQAGVVTIAVAGNHDAKVLPQLATLLEDGAFILLGKDGQWESQVIPVGDEKLRVDGWSFRSPSQKTNPVNDYSDAVGELDDFDLRIGMIHGDLDDTSSKYAPLNLAELSNKDVDGWLLGHVHVPKIRHSERPWVLYPGSPQALDPGEQGAHGVWLLDSAAGRLPELIELSSVKYSQFPIDISDCEEDGGVQAFVIKAIHEKAEELADASGHALQSLSLRVQVTGDCNDPEEVQVALEKLTDLDLSIPDVTTRIDKASIVVTPRLDPTIYEGQTTALAKAVNLMSALEDSTYPEWVEGLLEQWQGLEEQCFKRQRGSTEGMDDVLSGQTDRVRKQLALIINSMLEQQK